MSSNKYYPFGDRRNSTGSLGTDRLFTGQRLDGTGLYFYEARYYDPVIGRFISADTIIPSYLDPQSLNRYSYVYNNPLKYKDEDGHLGFLAAAGIGALINVGVYVGKSLVRHDDITLNGVVRSAVSGAVSGALATIAIIPGANVLVGMVQGGVANELGTIAGELAGKAVGAITGNAYQAHIEVSDLAASFVAGGLGAGAAQGVSSLLKAGKATFAEGADSFMPTLKSTFWKVEDDPLEIALIAAFVPAVPTWYAEEKVDDFFDNTLYWDPAWDF